MALALKRRLGIRGSDRALLAANKMTREVGCGSQNHEIADPDLLNIPTAAKVGDEAERGQH